MAKKKEETQNKKEEETPFDWTIPFNALECPNMFKQGLKFYIINNNLEIKDEVEFKKIVKNFANLQIGD